MKCLVASASTQTETMGFPLFLFALFYISKPLQQQQYNLGLEF